VDCSCFAGLHQLKAQLNIKVLSAHMGGMVRSVISVLCAAGGALLLYAVACCVLVARRHSKHSQPSTGQASDSVSGPTSKLHLAALVGSLFGTSTPTSSGVWQLP
jgi:hypothetical protein